MCLSYQSLTLSWSMVSGIVIEHRGDFCVGDRCVVITWNADSMSLDYHFFCHAGMLNCGDSAKGQYSKKYGDTSCMW